MALPLRKPLIEEALGGDTIASIAQNPVPIHLCLEDPDARSLQREPAGQRFKLRLANNETRRSSANCLIQRRYAWRNYKIGELQGNDPARITLAAHGQSGITGTVSVGLDASAGLFVDDLYRPEANTLRREGRRLCEFTKLAVDNDVRSRPLLAALFHLAFIYARRMYYCTDLLIEVNPRHVSFYRRMLGFRQIGPQRFNARVAAPAVLLSLCLSHAETQIAHLGGHPQMYATERSLYP
ncbi:MAG: N-acyl amino acid synthase FeeM domain-containing protein, partial [Casimicrobiaceae bacterium]